MDRTLLRAVVVAVFVSQLAACASSGGATRAPGPVPPASDGPSRGAELRTDAEREALWRARVDSARQRFTPADVRFMTRMISHHAQAVSMAVLAPLNEASPPIQTLAARILNAQQDEITIMQRWLHARGQPVPELHVDGTQVMVHGAEGDHAHHAQMPGMLSDEQLGALAQARGAAFDRLFLSSMIEHHRGAVVMVDELFAIDGAVQDPEVFRFASDVQVDQRTEVARMESMLAERSRLPDGS